MSFVYETSGYWTAITGSTKCQQYRYTVVPPISR